jgi:hypothetical protein
VTGSPSPAAPSPTSTPTPVSIADASPTRLLRDTDVSSPYGRRALSPTEQAATVRLPCASGPPASDAQVVDRSAMGMSFASTPPGAVDSDVTETLTLYGPGGATRYVAELTAALAACPSEPSGSGTVGHAIVQRGIAGDESVVIADTNSPPANPRIPSISGTFTVVVRADDVVLVLRLSPFESGETRREVLDQVLAKAIGRAED